MSCLRRTHTRGEAWEIARRNEREDLDRAREYQEGVVIVEAWHSGHRLGGDSLAGLDLNSETRESLEDVIREHDMIGNAIDMAEAERARLCRAFRGTS